MDGHGSVWNEELIREVVEDDVEMLHELVELFVTDTAERVRQLDRGVADGDCDLVMRQAHAVKGASGNFGAERLHRVACQLEKCGIGGDLGGCKDALERLQSELSELMATLDEKRPRP